MFKPCPVWLRKAVRWTVIAGRGWARLLPERDMKFSAVTAIFQDSSAAAKEWLTAAADWDTTLDRAPAHRTLT